MCVEFQNYKDKDRTFDLKFSEYILHVSWNTSKLKVVLSNVNKIDLVEHHSCGKTTRYIRNTDLKYQPFERVDDGYLLTSSENIFVKINGFNCFTFKTIYWSLHVICKEDFSLDCVFVIDSRTNDKLLTYNLEEELVYAK